MQRLPRLCTDPILRKSFVLYTLTAEGMPIIYYGSEQGYVGGTSYDENREVLWTSGYATQVPGDGITYEFIALVNALRHLIPRELFASTHQYELYVDDHFYAFKRGIVVVAFTNAGSSDGVRHARLTNVSWTAGTTVCNLFDPLQDCLFVSTDFEVEIMLTGGAPKVYAPNTYVGNRPDMPPSARESGVAAVELWASERIHLAETEFNRTNQSRVPSPHAWSDHVVYQVMLDRFANGDPSNDRVNLKRDQRARMDTSQLGGIEGWRHGGDLRGLIDRLDYLVDLGTDVLYLNPVFHHTGSYHGYCTTDFTIVDPGFGTNEDFRELVQQAHARGMRVILDIVQHLCVPAAVYSAAPGPECIALNYDGKQSGEVHPSGSVQTDAIAH